MGVDVENNYEPHYISIRGKGDVIKELRKEAKKAAHVYLAADPDCTRPADSPFLILAHNNGEIE